MNYVILGTFVLGWIVWGLALYGVAKLTGY